MSITAKEKAKELINMYYSHAKTQREAVEICELVMLTRMCQEIDSLFGHVCEKDDFSEELIKSRIRELKGYQEIAAELQRLKPIEA